MIGRLIIVGFCAFALMACSGPKTVEMSSLVSDETTVAETSYGRVQGYLEDGIYTFKGIQYAKAERFMPPQYPDKFEGVKPCRVYGPKAPQSESLRWRRSDSDYDFAFQFKLEPMDEDNCLVLNVWSKGIGDGKKRPVFVWFHGGGFSTGSGIDLPCYEGKNLADKGDIVVVTLNHRLNVLGYLDLRGLGGKYSESVNLGQQDLVKALEWVHSNIANFGGDPGNVTIGGQSGGGGKVTCTLAMPSAKGLFQRAIVQSGSNMPSGEGEATKNFGLAFAKELGVDASNADKLAEFSYDELIQASSRASRAFRGVGFGGSVPTMDGKYIVEASAAPELSRDVPMLVGTNLYEFSYSAKPEMTLAEAVSSLSSKMDSSKVDEFVATYEKFFPAFEPRDLVNTDFFFRRGAVSQVDAKSAQGGAPAYLYLFAWKPQGSDIGACHGMELPFIFNNISRQREMTRSTPDAFSLADKISSAWISFIRTGDPNASSSGLPHWEAYTKEGGEVMVLDNSPRLERGLDRELGEAKSAPVK